MTRVRRRQRDDRGTATAFVVGLTIALLAVAGLVVDGGTALNARMRLADDVEQAARAGAQEIDVPVLRATGQVVLDAGAARERARLYVLQRGYTEGQITVTADAVTVAADDTVQTRLLGLIGIDTFSVTASATADAVTQ